MMTAPQIIDRGRGPELAGTRFTVFDVVPYLQKGRNADYVAALLGMTTEQAEALIEYIRDHEAEILSQHAAIEERIARGNSPEIEAKLAAARGNARALRDKLVNANQEGNGASHSK